MGGHHEGRRGSSCDEFGRVWSPGSRHRRDPPKDDAPVGKGRQSGNPRDRRERGHLGGVDANGERRWGRDVASSADQREEHLPEPCVTRPQGTMGGAVRGGRDGERNGHVRGFQGHQRLRPEPRGLDGRAHSTNAREFPRRGRRERVAEVRVPEEGDDGVRPTVAQGTATGAIGVGCAGCAGGGTTRARRGRERGRPRPGGASRSSAARRGAGVNGRQHRGESGGGPINSQNVPRGAASSRRPLRR